MEERNNDEGNIGRGAPVRRRCVSFHEYSGRAQLTNTPNPQCHNGDDDGWHDMIEDA